MRQLQSTVSWDLIRDVLEQESLWRALAKGNWGTGPQEEVELPVVASVLSRKGAWKFERQKYQVILQ